MKRSSFLIALVVMVLAQARMFAQESAAGGQAETSGLASTDQTAAPLTPPADNSATATGPAPSAPATTSSTTTTTTTTEAPKSSSTEMSPREIERIQQQEIIRRQELTFRANEALAAAQKAELGTNYPEARKNYLFAAEAYGSISRSTAAYAKAAEGLTRVDDQLFEDALKIGDTARAKQLMDETVKYNPNNRAANERLAAINKALADPNDTKLLGNVAVTPGFVAKVNKVQEFFAEAEQYRRTGQWDLAEARLKEILGMDPYNIAATKQLERIDAEKNQYAETARLETRDERLRQVEEKWYEPINNKDLASSAQESQPSLVASTTFDLDQKLKSVFLSLDFNNASIEEATNFLSIESKRLDPDHKGVNFIIQPEASASAKPISLTLNNVPLGEALRYVCQLANVKFKVQDYAISIVPFTQNTDDLISHNFIVQPNFVVPPSAGGTVQSAATSAFSRPIASGAAPSADTTATTDAGDTVRQALEAKGVKFPPGASAVYTPTTGQLTVVDTADQMELIEELVNAGQAPTLMVRIATKFVEINQNDLNDLTINSALNLNFLNASLAPGVFATGGTTLTNNPLITTSNFSTALPGANGFSPNGVDQLLATQAPAFNSLYMRSFLNIAQFNLVVTALSQKKSYDLLSEPAVLTKSGEQGVLEAVRVFPYPIAFDPPELLTQQQNTGGTTSVIVVTISPPVVIASTPTDFKKRNVGVRLVVRPQVTADSKTIDLLLFPEVTDFQGFINYGTPIYVPNPPNLGLASQSLLSNNPVQQPVFNTRRINTQVLIKDGSTVVLGGLIREDTQTVNDKVPFLGDLPLIGRLFQSKAIENTKRNLIIFVTANIYRNDGELLNPPEVANAADILTGHASYTSPAAP